MKIVKGPEPVTCSCCGTMIEYESKDVMIVPPLPDTFDQSLTVFIECPVCTNAITIGKTRAFKNAIYKDAKRGR